VTADHEEQLLGSNRRIGAKGHRRPQRWRAIRHFREYILTFHLDSLGDPVVATSLPYLMAIKNLPPLFDKIASAKIPESFTHSFLQTTIGLKSTADRALIPLLRNLGFIDQSGTPTPSYRLLKGDNRRAALAAGIRKAYQPLFDADQDAHKLSNDKLRGLVAQVAGTDAELTGRITGTFAALARIADFDTPSVANGGDAEKKQEQDADQDTAAKDKTTPKGLRTEFHYNLQIHLPSNGTEETYLNVFNAIRKTFQ
jgi:hypothetical protein